MNCRLSLTLKHHARQAPVSKLYDESFDLGASLHMQLTHQIEDLALALPKFAFFYSNGGLQFLLRQL